MFPWTFHEQDKISYEVKSWAKEHVWHKEQREQLFPLARRFTVRTCADKLLILPKNYQKLLLCWTEPRTCQRDMLQGFTPLCFYDPLYISISINLNPIHGCPAVSVTERKDTQPWHKHKSSKGWCLNWMLTLASMMRRWWSILHPGSARHRRLLQYSTLFKGKRWQVASERQVAPESRSS